MRLLRHAKLLIGITAIVVAALPALAGAHMNYVYEGSDVAYTTSDHTRGLICDRESDDNPAYIRFTVTNGSNSIRVDDQDGSGGYCWQSSVFYYVLSHKACEGTRFTEDPCTSYVTS
jgi:hypothetical protein